MYPHIRSAVVRIRKTHRLLLPNREYTEELHTLLRRGHAHSILLPSATISLTGSRRLPGDSALIEGEAERVPPGTGSPDPNCKSMNSSEFRLPGRGREHSRFRNGDRY